MQGQTTGRSGLPRSSCRGATKGPGNLMGLPIAKGHSPTYLGVRIGTCLEVARCEAALIWQHVALPTRLFSVQTEVDEFKRNLPLWIKAMFIQGY